MCHLWLLHIEVLVPSMAAPDQDILGLVEEKGVAALLKVGEVPVETGGHSVAAEAEVGAEASILKASHVRDDEG